MGTRGGVWERRISVVVLWNISPCVESGVETLLGYFEEVICEINRFAINLSHQASVRSHLYMSLPRHFPDCARSDNHFNCNVIPRVGNLANFSPKITDDFKSLTDVSWYASVYLLTATAFQPTFGKVYQIFNVKGTYIFVMSLFMLGSLISAVAGNSLTFIIGRAIAGLGVGGAFSGGLTIIAYSVPLNRQAAFTGALGALFRVYLCFGMYWY